MTSTLTRTALAAALSVGVAATGETGVKAEEHTRVELGGALGGVLKLFGGKAAKEGIVTKTTVLGDRRLLIGEENGQIVDLAEERIYDLDLKKKSYTVTTFADIKKKFEEMRAKAEKEQEKQRAQTAAKSGQLPPEAAPELEVEFQASNQPDRKQIAGHEARLVILRVTVHEKGRSVQQAGGIMIRNDLWLTSPKLAELDELEAWNRRFAVKMAEIYGVPASTDATDQMAKLLVSYPSAAKAMERMHAEMEKVNLEGTQVAGSLTITGIRSAEQLAQAEKESMNPAGGIHGFLAKKAFQKATGDPTEPRQMLLTTTRELLKVSKDATDADVAVPAGLKAK
jgi:hypothetical protein